MHLGVQALRAAFDREPERMHREDGAQPARLPLRVAYRQGVISDLGNPKIAAFFTSLLPQFGTTEAGSSFWLMLALGLVFCMLTRLWLALYSTAVARVLALLQRPRVRRSFEAITGTMLVALGVRLATARQPA